MGIERLFFHSDRQRDIGAVITDNKHCERDYFILGREECDNGYKYTVAPLESFAEKAGLSRSQYLMLAVDTAVRFVVDSVMVALRGYMGSEEYFYPVSYADGILDVKKEGESYVVLRNDSAFEYQFSRISRREHIETEQCKVDASKREELLKFVKGGFLDTEKFEDYCVMLSDDVIELVSEAYRHGWKYSLKFTDKKDWAMVTCKADTGESEVVKNFSVRKLEHNCPELYHKFRFMDLKRHFNSFFSYMKAAFRK